ncbi:MAG: right-handed parallel beta-helix repeat-containing protein, partial [Myxococcota bacterium]
IEVATWTDGPGVCPPGLPQVDLHTAEELAAAARGDEPFDADPPATCYFVHDGEYAADGVLLYLLRGGAPDAPRVFVGQTRDGVVIRSRAGTDPERPIADLVLSNLTLDLTGYDGGSGSFNTLSLYEDSRIRIDHVTFTGDCATGLRGAHLETNGTTDLVVDSCLIENYGHCGPEGHEDHGVYLANGSDLVFVNNWVRGNASRGFQLYTQGGEYGTLDGVVLERNRISGNGHGDYEDGIVINAYGTGTIEDVVIRHNLLDDNHYSGIRFAGGLMSGVVVQNNTFYRNGVASGADGRSELNVDDEGGGAGATFDRNLFVVEHHLINDCHGGADLGFHVGDNFVDGDPGSGGDGSCLGPQTTGDPHLTDPAGGDFVPLDPVAATYGAWAP